MGNHRGKAALPRTQSAVRKPPRFRTNLDCSDKYVRACIATKAEIHAGVWLALDGACVRERSLSIEWSAAEFALHHRGSFELEMLIDECELCEVHGDRAAIW